MSIEVSQRSIMISDRTGHQARSVGQGGWVVSFLPGRTLSAAQAVAALRAAEDYAAIEGYAGVLGLTALELAGMAAAHCHWPLPQRMTRRPRWGGR
ncbi:hypothetical protein [Nocardia terpenica]|nr:hypothetical protein [Nocardia terpenica]